MTQESHAAAPSEHAHRWRIEEPQGSESVGVCTRCGETKSFKNWLAETDFITNEERRQAAA